MPTRSEAAQQQAPARTICTVIAARQAANNPLNQQLVLTSPYFTATAPSSRGYIFCLNGYGAYALTLLGYGVMGGEHIAVMGEEGEGIQAGSVLEGSIHAIHSATLMVFLLDGTGGSAPLLRQF